jgi:hypothetical protein
MSRGGGAEALPAAHALPLSDKPQSRRPLPPATGIAPVAA